MSALELRNALLPDGRVQCVVVQGGLIRAIRTEYSISNRFIDIGGLLVVPAANFMHGHFRLPGGEHKETWRCAVQAAYYGGVATVADQANTNPSTTTEELYYDKVSQIGDPGLRYRLWFGATAHNRGEFRKVCGHPLFAGVKTFMGSSTGDLLVDDEDDQLAIFRECALWDILQSIHSEHEPTIRANRARFLNPTAADHNRIRTPEAAIMSTEKALWMQEKTGCRLLVLHVTTVAELEMCWQAKLAGRPVYVETCPQYWLIDDSMGLKFNPPGRSLAERARFLELIGTEGVVDVIAPDHAPHHPDEQDPALSYDKMMSGIPGLEECLRHAFGLVRADIMSLGHFIALTSSNAAQLFNLPNGQIAPGYAADLVVLDPNATITLRNEDMHTLHRRTVYNGMEVAGDITLVIIGGEIKVNKLANN